MYFNGILYAINAGPLSLTTIFRHFSSYKNKTLYLLKLLDPSLPSAFANQIVPSRPVVFPNIANVVYVETQYSSFGQRFASLSLFPYSEKLGFFKNSVMLYEYHLFKSLVWDMGLLQIVHCHSVELCPALDGMFLDTCRYFMFGNLGSLERI